MNVQTPAEHIPVLLAEAIAGMAIRSNGIYVDATYGRGGHSEAILAELDQDGRLLALDRDAAAVQHGQRRFADDTRFTIVQGNFAALAQHYTALAWPKPGVAGILLDLGVSSPQLDDPQRGFSFRHDGPLDMRMDRNNGPSAADWLAQASETEIAQVLRELGEERFARRVARSLIHRRRDQAINRTQQLAEIVAAAVPTRERHKHPATRSFQAIRMHVNQELAALEAGLHNAVQLLAPGGRLVVISFHSLEDRLVKRFMRQDPPPSNLPRRLPPPTYPTSAGPRVKPIGKPIFPNPAEYARNPRARSACLRIAERLP